MYQIFYKDFLLHDLRTDYYLVNPILTEKLSKINELSFQIYPNHPHFDKLDKLIPKIVLKKDGATIFKGRIIKDNQQMDKSKQVTCESVLAFLVDTMQKPFEFQGSPQNLFQYFINNHNTQVGTFSKTSDTTIMSNKIYFTYDAEKSLYEQVIVPDASFLKSYYEADGEKVLYIGKMTGANLDNNDYINRSSEDYVNTFNSITSKLLETIGGYMLERYENNGIFVDWVDDFTEGDSQIISTQTIEFGNNLINIAVDNDASETYSVVIPLGAEIENEDGTKERLTITSVNEGKDYLVNETALALYGWIVAPVEETTWDDVTLPTNLKNKAQDYLDNKAVMLKSTLQLNAIDLNTIDKSISNFRMGSYIKVQSTPHNISKTYLLTEKQTPLTKPESMTVTLGESKSTLTGIQLGNQQSTIQKVENMTSDFVTNKDVTVIVNEEIENSSIIQQMPSEILTQVSESYMTTTEAQTAIDEMGNSLSTTIEELQETMSTQMSQTAQGWEFEFNQIVQQITSIDGTVNANYQELIKFIRFVDGKITLGEVGNEITLELQNDRLSFYNNNVEVAYITDGRIYITDGEFTHSLAVGNFAFIPRNNGSLDFKKVKG